MENKSFDTAGITKKYSRKICELFNEPKYIYGEMYSDIVLGALLSIIEDSEKRRTLEDTAFDKSMKTDKAMCVALTRVDGIEKARQLAEKIGAANAILSLFGLGMTNTKYDEINQLIKEYADAVNAVTPRK